VGTPFFVPLGVGMESDIAEQLIQPGSVPLLENLRFDNRGQLVRRVGNPQLSAAGGLPHTWRLETLEGALVRFNEASATPLHVWSNQDASWVFGGLGNVSAISSGRRGPISVRERPVISELHGGEAVICPDVAIANGYAVVAYERNTAASSFTEHLIFDLTSGAIVFRRRLGSGTARPRPIAIGTRVLVAYEDNGKIQLDVYDLTTLTISGARTMGNCLAGTQIYTRVGAVVAGSNFISILYRENTAGKLTGCHADITNLASNATYEIKGAGGTTQVPNLAFGWLQDLGASGKVSVMVADTTNGLRDLWDLPAPTAGVSTAAATHVLDAGATAVPSGATPGITNLIGATTANVSSGSYRVLYEVTAPNAPTRGAIKTVVVTAGGAGSPASLYLSVNIRSQFWMHDGVLYFWSAFSGDQQQTYFALAADFTANSLCFPTPHASAFVRSAGGVTEKFGQMSQIATSASGELYAAVTSFTRVESVASAGTATGTAQNIRAINLVALTHRTAGDAVVGRGVELIGSLFMPGGTPLMFDGHDYGMPSFSYYPPSVNALSSAGGNLTPSSTYLYRALYSFVDANGRKWRGTPSTPLSAATSGTNFQFTLNVETLRLIDRGVLGASTVGTYQIEVYRTQADEVDAFFLVASIQNDPTSTTVSVVDNVADANLGEELYTDGGGLENQLVPAAAHLAQFQRRLFMAQAGTGTLWYSLDVDLNHGLLFNEALTLDVGDPNDPITALGATDTYLVVLKSSRVYIVTGQGGDSQGNNATYEARLVESGVGCSQATSVVAAPDGTVWFKSGSARAGFHRVNGLSVEYVGAGVRAYNSLTVTAAAIAPNESQLRFYTIEGRTLIWSWITTTWSTNIGQTCWSATGGYEGSAGAVYANTAGAVLADGTAGVNFDEGGVGYVAHLRSPWLSVGEIESWERIQRIQGVGINPRAHKLVVTLYRDFDLTDSIGTLSKQFDGTGTKWEWEIRPRVQKLSALLIDIQIQSYQPPAGGPAVTTDGPQISGVTLIVATKAGLKKKAAAARLVSS
jgi:hypothetical protein